MLPSKFVLRGDRSQPVGYLYSMHDALSMGTSVTVEVGAAHRRTLQP